MKNRANKRAQEGDGRYVPTTPPRHGSALPLPPPPPPPPVPEDGQAEPWSEDCARYPCDFRGTTYDEALVHLGFRAGKPVSHATAAMRTTWHLQKLNTWDVPSIVGLINAETILLEGFPRPGPPEQVDLGRDDCGLTIIRGFLDGKTANLWFGQLRKDIDLRAWSDKSPFTAFLSRCYCYYKYRDEPVPPQSLSAHLAYMTIARLISKLTLPGVHGTPDSVNVNLYPSGMSSLNWHSDDERLFDAVNNDASIISLSFGAARNFQIREKLGNHQFGPAASICLAAGDVLCMSGRFQRHYQHKVGADQSEERLNLTFRYIKVHEPYCSSASGSGAGPSGAHRRQ